MDLLNAIVSGSPSLSNLVRLDVQKLEAVLIEPSKTTDLRVQDEQLHSRLLLLAKGTCQAFNLWRKGESVEALSEAQKLLKLDCSDLDPYAQLVARYLPALLLADRGQADRAQNLLPDISYAFQSKDAAYGKILSLAHAWLFILTERLDEARALLAQPLLISDQGLKSHSLVLTSILHYLDGDESNAEDNLHQASEYYATAPNAPATAMIQFYIAAVQLGTGCEHLAIGELNKALTTMERGQQTHLPFWWHPGLLKRILAQVVSHSDVMPYAQVVLARLRTELHTSAAPSTGALQTVQPLQTLNEPSTPNHKKQAKSKACPKRNELTQLINSGYLDEFMLTDLAHKIPHGTSNGRINPSIIAVFGLHLLPVPNREIAERLKLSSNTVRSYLTKIYGAFELGHNDYPTSEARWHALRKNAKDAGYIL